MDDLGRRIKVFPGANPGCLLDEHKRADCIFLKRRWLELRDIDDRSASELVAAVNDAQDLYNSTSTDASFEVVEQSKLMLKTHLDDVKARFSTRSLLPTYTPASAPQNIFFDRLNKIVCNLLSLVSEAPMDRLPKTLPRLPPVIVNFGVNFSSRPLPIFMIAVPQRTNLFAWLSTFKLRPHAFHRLTFC